MAHPIYKDAPSKDMTAAQERQRHLDAQIEAFLAKGGEIKAFDTLRRPVAPGEWSKFSIVPRPPAPVAAPNEQPAPEPAQIELPAVVETAPAAEPEVLLQEVPVTVSEPAHQEHTPTKVKPMPVKLDDERLAVKIILEAALGGSPRVIARNLRIPLNRCLAIAEQCRVQFHG